MGQTVQTSQVSIIDESISSSSFVTEMDEVTERSSPPPPPSVTKQKKRIAIIGGGVSGLSCAWHLISQSSGNKEYDVHVFEKSHKLGGHAYTVRMDEVSTLPVDVDIGFMVFNDDNYPNMSKWFESLGVESENSDMSLSISLDEGNTVEWSSLGMSGLFANRWQLFKPQFYSFINEMLRFNKEAAQILTLPKNDPNRVITTAQYLRQNGYSDAFCKYYLLPMMAALWSASLEDVLQFPAEQLIGFLCNHRMLQIFDRPCWKTVAGRSQSYVLKLASILGNKCHLDCEIMNFRHDKETGKYYLSTKSSKDIEDGFDEIVFACQPSIAASIMNGVEKNNQMIEVLNEINYADNVIYVHSDENLMPKRKSAWSSWNCIGRSELLISHNSTAKSSEAMEGGESGFGARSVETNTAIFDGAEGRMKAVYITYWLNKLQNLQTEKNIFVSLNPHVEPDISLVHKRVIMAHPQFTPQALRARQVLLEKYQGEKGLWFCGAWMGYGFHEDGCRSGFKVAASISGIPLPWAEGSGQLVLPPPDLAQNTIDSNNGILDKMKHFVVRTIPVAVSKYLILKYMKKAVKYGSLKLITNDGCEHAFGDGSRCGCDDHPVSLRIFDDWFFVKVALEYDLGLARSYMAGHFVVEPLMSKALYDPVIGGGENSRDETTITLGDPVGLTRLFLLFIGNRDHTSNFSPKKSSKGHLISNALTNASGLMVSKLGSFLNFLRYKLTMDNSERGGSLKNIHAHYDLSNDLFRTFLDKETLMYSSAIFDAVKAREGQNGMVFRGNLEEAQWRKLDTLLSRAQVQPNQTLLDIGFGWGGLSLYAAKKYGCRVTGVTLSVEQKALAERRVTDAGLEHLITFEVVDYRTFARRKENRSHYDRVISCEMIEAVGHEHLGEFFWAVEQVLKPNGVLVMEAITTPESRYETYRRSTDLINTIIFPGSCCPSLHALVDASYKNSSLTLEHIDNIGLHYARTLAEWRRRFNASEKIVRRLGFDDIFMRVWNYYLSYCESGFHSQTENCLILVFSRPGCNALVPLCETRSVTQLPALTDIEIDAFLN